MQFVKNNFLIIAITMLFFGCGDSPQDKSPRAQKNRYERLSPQEQKDLAPNELFQAIYSGNIDEAKALASSESQLLEETNSANGDTPVGVAIKLKEVKIAKMLINKLSPESLKHINNNWETYIYLASQTGLVEIIESLSNKYESYLSGLEFYDFADIDRPNILGERALFVALNQETARSLAEFWFKGIFNYKHPFNDFFHHRNIFDETFLFKAAADNRFEVINWARNIFCGDNSWQAEDKNLPQNFFGSLWNFFVDLQIARDNIFNRVNISGDSPLHIAIRQQKPEATTAITQCEELDFGIQNNIGHSPMIESLAAIDTLNKESNESSKRIFNSVFDKKTRLWAWIDDTSYYVNLADEDGNSALHWAARLADPYYYNKLTPHGDIYLKNTHGQTPAHLFSARLKK